VSRIKRLFVAVALTILASTVPSVAYASPADLHDCPDDYFCVWEDANATGPFAKFQVGSPDLAKAISGHVFNDRVTYVWNRTTRLWCLFKDAHYVGYPLRISVEWQGPLGPRYNFDNLVSSLQACDLS
jgi:peptidase inhibitor family I36